MANGQTTQNTPFFNPDPISTQDYLSGPVDFYSQSLGQATGIQVTDPNADDKDEKEEDTAPNIFAPIGADDRGREDMSTLSGGLQKGLETNPEETFKSFGVSDVNVNNLGSASSITSYTDAGFFSQQTGDLVSSFASDFGSNLDAATPKVKSITDVFTDFSGTIKGLGTGLQVEKPFGEGLATMTAPPAIAAVMGPAAPVFSAFAAIGGALNMAQQRQFAAAYKATGAGFIGEINGMMVGRLPGGFQYGGNLSFMDQEQVKNLEAISKGYLVGTMTAETYEDGKWGDTGGVDDVIDSKDVFKSGGSFNQNGSWTGLDGQTYGSPTKQNVQDYTNALNSKYGSSLSSSQVSNAMKSVKTEFSFDGAFSRPTGTRVVPGTPTGQQLVLDLISNDLDQQGKFGGDTESQTFAEGLREESLVDQMTSKTSKSVLGKTTGNTALDRYIEQSVAKQKAAFAAEEQAAAAAKVKAGKEVAGGSKSDPYGGGVKDGGGAFGGLSDREKDSAGRSSAGGTGGNPGDKSTWAEGGRVGMQAGGEAGFAQRPEFVGGNETPTNRQSIADNVPREVPEGTFVINAAAVDFAGREDIEKMVRKAYAKAGQGRQTGTAQEVDIAVSNGEVLIPPHIAKIIGYDRLNKINNRGKKEISRRQEERQQAAGGGFIGRKKFAEGDMVLPKSKPKRVNQSGLADVELRADLEVYIQNDPLARLGFNLYEKGDVDVKAIVLPARKKVRVGVGGVYTPKDRQRDPGPAARRFEGFAQKQGLTKSNNKVAGIHYFEGDNVNYGRAEGPLTLLHELRHHAMRHLNKKYKVPLPELSFEESMFDAQDYVNRLQARKVKPSIRSKPKSKDLEIRQKNMYMSPSANKELATYQSIAEQVLQDRKVPQRTKSKQVEGFFTRAMGLLGL